MEESNEFLKNLGYHVAKSVEFGGAIHYYCNKHKLIHNVNLSKKETKESVCKNYKVN